MGKVSLGLIQSGDAVERRGGAAGSCGLTVPRLDNILQVTSSDREGLLPHVPVTRFGSDEVIQKGGDVPSGMTGSAYAIGKITVLQIDRNTLEQLVSRTPALLQDLSPAIDERSDRAREAAAQVEHPVAATDSAERAVL